MDYLKITQQNGLIGMQISKPAIQMDIRPPALQVENNPAELEIKNTPPRVFIDQTECQKDKGLFNPVDMIAESRQKSYASGLEAIGAIASRGDGLAAIGRGSTVATVAAGEISSRGKKDFNVVAVPSQPPQFQAEVQKPEITVRPSGVDCELQRGEVNIEANLGKVEIYLQQKPSLKIEWVGSYLDAQA